ncbi:efflux RND transporter periplasmic adaptor subunit [Singulisphaera sp. PoT]|uniref:efflux RND transporter periplasmic adaptor subunit n=1 Tax=Singulisphaera sp. PoT TaxID=3411797 RepID=UPI003BF54924
MAYRMPWNARLFSITPLIVLAAVARTVCAGEPPKPGQPIILVKRCSVEYKLSSRLGPSTIGVLQDCLVRPGDKVKAGQALGHLFNHDARIDYERWSMEADSMVDIELSKAKLAEVMSRSRAAEELRKRKFVSDEDMNRLRLEVTAATKEVEGAIHRQRLAKIQKQQAEAVLLSREIVSPFDGVVVFVGKSVGEPILATESFIRVVNTENLSIIGHLDITDAWRVTPGQRVRVMPDVQGADLAVEQEVFDGRITFVDSEIDPRLRTCKVIAEVENRSGLLRAGIDAHMEILPKYLDAQSATSGRAQGAP